MILRLRFLVMSLVLLLAGFIGWRSYVYIFDSSSPTLIISGLETDHHYSGDMQCTVASSKSGDVSLWLDDQPLVNQFRISGGAQGHAFTIPTKTLVNGKHHLKAVINDTTYHKNSSILDRDFYADNVPLQAALVKTDGEYRVFQGRTLHVQFQVNKDIKQAKISALSQEYECFPESKNSSIYEAFIPISCEENPNEYLFSIDVADHVNNATRLDNKFQVVMFPFKTTSLHVSNEKVQQEQEMGRDDKQLDELIQRLTQNSPKEKLWKGTFCTPIEIQRISTEFGAIRTTQHKGRYAHKALDILNLPRSVVWASQDGTVVLKDRFAMSGNTVIIDHGLGVLSMYFHLDDFAKIEVGQKIAKGNPVGTLGKTGYASGYHLHWEMRVNNVAVDPMQWTKPIF